MFRPRNGDQMVRCEGAKFGFQVWCDESGEFQIDNTSGVSTFFFHKEGSSSDGNLVVRCKQWKRRCPVKAKISTDGIIHWLKNIHNHTPERNGYGKTFYECRSEWIREIREDPQKPPMKSIMKARRKVHPDVARIIVPERHSRTARYQAAKVRPASVRNLSSLHVAINGDPIPGYTISNHDERLLSFLFAHSETLILTTRRQLDLVHHAEMLHADATYRCTPRRICKQVFSIHANVRGHVEMVLCALMNKRNAAAYGEVFGFLKQQTNNKHVLQSYMGDFDTAIRRAVHDEFPDARIYGCHFHYSQALVRRASNHRVGLAKEIRQPSEVLKKFVALTVLPLLPAKEIEPLFRELSEEAMQVSPKFRRLLDYIEDFWLGTIGVGNLSLFGVPNGCRTNNAVESFHLKLNKEVGAHPSTWNLVATLNGFCTDGATNIETREDGVEHIMSKPSRPTRENDDRIRAAWQCLEQGNITPRQFLDKVKYRIGGAAARYGLSDDDGNLMSDVSDHWDEWMEEQDALEDHDYCLIPLQPTFSDHTYARSSFTAVDHICSRPLARQHQGRSGVDRDDDPKDGLFAAASAVELRDLIDPGEEEQVHDEKSSPQIPTLTKAMSEMIDDAIGKPDDRVLIRVGKNTVTRGDLNTLSGNSWLNDVIINTYMALIVQRSKNDPHLPKVYAFDTFFLLLLKNDDYGSVRRCTKDVDIFEQDLLLIPVFANSHWTLIVVDLRNKHIKYLDSMGKPSNAQLDLILEYLAQELEEKKECHLNYDEWQLFDAQDIPLQGNGFDCGIFSLKYADYAARNADINFSQIDMPYFRRRMMVEILQAEIFPCGYGNP